MGIGLSGMVSGLDTEAIVKAMVSGQKAKSTKVENKITLNKWTTEAWGDLNKKIYSFYTTYASKLRLSSSYMTRKASSSNESIVSATAGSNAAVGTHTLQVTQLASSQYVTGTKLSQEPEKYNRNTKLTDLGMAKGSVITVKGNLDTINEKERKLEITDGTTIDDFLKTCKDAGLSASFDLQQQRFFISSANSGRDDAFSITSAVMNEDSLSYINGLKDELKDYGTDLSGDFAVLRQNANVVSSVLSNPYDEENANPTEKRVHLALENIKKAVIETEANKQAEDELRQSELDAIRQGKTEGTFELYGSEFNYEDLVSELEEGILKAYRDGAVKASYNNLVEMLGEENKLSGAYADISSMTYEDISNAENVYTELLARDDYGTLVSTYDFTNEDDLNAALEAGDLNSDEVNAIKVHNTWNYSVDDGVNVFDMQSAYASEYNGALTSDYESDLENAIREKVASDKAEERRTEVDARTVLYSTDDPEDDSDFYSRFEEAFKTETIAGIGTGYDGGVGSQLGVLGLGEITGENVKNVDSNGDSVGMVVVKAEDAKVVLDGASMSGSTNTFSVNGMTFDLKSTTYNKLTDEYDTMTVTVSKDTESTYSFVKEALKEYNDLVEEMNKKYNAASSRGYDPLTPEQKEEMTDDEVEKWEAKIKDSLLRKDNTLGSLMSAMRTSLATSYKASNGKEYSLSSFGIVTGTYTENGKLHIYGDKEDSLYATYDDRLKSALAEDPDAVMESLSNIFTNLYETMSDKCGKTKISSALTFYNDVQYNTYLTRYEKELKEANKRLSDLEQRYYKQFTAMETAMSKLQSQTNSLSQMLGMNNNNQK